MSDRDRDTPAPRDRRGRYVTGASGNLTGKPRGCLNQRHALPRGVAQERA